MLAIAGGVVWTQVYEPGHAKQLAWHDVTGEVHGQALWPKSVTRSFWRQRQVDRYLTRIFPAGRPTLPRVDYARDRLVLIAAGPRSSTGYRVRVLKATERRGDIHILARELTPPLGEKVQARLTSPYRLITIPATGKRVYVQWQGRP
ncbi:MAG TPA: protease complex subunit PrcB family protein [Gaiellaceae bacterium]|nr:protease complex subunit PrcB family protein [Gaiellaceae bacterium]